METSTNTDNPEKKQKIEKQKKLVADLFSTLNLVFTQTKLGIEKSDLLLRAIHQFKKIPSLPIIKDINFNFK